MARSTRSQKTGRTTETTNEVEVNLENYLGDEVEEGTNIHRILDTRTIINDSSIPDTHRSSELEMLRLRVKIAKIEAEKAIREKELEIERLKRVLHQDNIRSCFHFRHHSQGPPNSQRGKTDFHGDKRTAFGVKSEKIKGADKAKQVRFFRSGETGHVERGCDKGQESLQTSDFRRTNLIIKENDKDNEQLVARIRIPELNNRNFRSGNHRTKLECGGRNLNALSTLVPK